MQPIILNDIPFDLDGGQLMESLHVAADSGAAAELRALIEEARAIARPKALYGVAYISSKSDDGVVVEGLRLSGRLLAVNLEHAHRLFPYLATCGTELDDWSHSMTDVLHQYWAEAIKGMALGAARKALDAHLNAHHAPGKTSTMSPGRLPHWPLTQQRPLFELLGNPEEAIGVRLTPSCLMVPNKSVSGIRFPTEESFESCQLCPREGCPGRKAPYDSGLYDRKYRLAKGRVVG